MNTQTKIARITEELRALINTDNDAPRLLAEMVSREFPKSAQEICQPELDELIGQIQGLRAENDRLRKEISDAEERIGRARDALNGGD